jgi:hypothetical protein
MNGKNTNQDKNRNIKGNLVLFHKKDKDDQNYDRVYKKPRWVDIGGRGEINCKVNETEHNEPFHKRIFM